MDKHLANTVRYPPKQYAGIVLLRLVEPITLKAIERAMSIFLDLAATRSPAGRLWIVDRERVREFEERDIP